MAIPTRQQAVRITGPGGPDVLRVAEIPVPSPGPGQLLIEVAAAGVNRHDCNQRRAGQSHDGTPIPGLEICGRVVAAGEGAEQELVGKRVMALVQGGGYAQYALASQSLAMPVPDCLEDREAAGIPEALFTAWYNFFFLMKLESHEHALIHGGTSGVGHLALQALGALGYTVFATSGSEEKAAAALRFGASAAFLYGDPELASKVMTATGGRGIDTLLDMSAGAHLASDLAMMAPGGRIAHLSAGGGKLLEVPLASLMARQVWITGSLLRPLPLVVKTAVADRIRYDLMPLLKQGRIRPHVHAVFPLADASAAHRLMEEGRHIGKIILTA